MLCVEIPSHAPQKLGPISVLIGAVVVFAISFLFLSCHLKVGKDQDTPPFFIDEAHKLAESVYWSLISDLDIGNPAWNEDFYARTNPPFGKYVLGISLELANKNVHHQQLQQHFEQLWKTPDLLRNQVEDSALLITRRTSSFFAALSCMVLFLIGYRIGGFFVALFSALLFIINPIFIYHGLIGLHDSLFLFLFSTICLATIYSAAALERWFEKARRIDGYKGFIRLFLLVQVLPSLLIAMAAGTRLNGFLALAVYAGGISSGFFYGPLFPGNRSREMGVRLLVIFCTCFLSYAIFLLINPYYYSNFLYKTINTIQACGDWIVKQQIEPGGGLFTLRERFTTVGFGILRAQYLPFNMLFGSVGTFLTTASFLVGVLSLVNKTVEKKPSVVRDTGFFDNIHTTKRDAVSVLIWSIICVFGTAIWLPLNWTRYLMIPMIGSTVLCSFGFGSILKLVTGNIWGRFEAERMGLRLRHAAVCVVVIGLTIILGFTSLVIDPALIDPDGINSFSSSPREQIYLEARSESISTIAIYRNHAILLIDQKRYGEAEGKLSEAMEILLHHVSDMDSLRVLKYQILAGLAKARFETGNIAGAAAAKGLQVAVLKEIKTNMKSSDPFVARSFDQIIEVLGEELKAMSVCDDGR